MNYKVGDRVYYSNGGSILEAIIVKIDHEEEDVNYKYCIRYIAGNEREYSIWTGKNSFKGLVREPSPEEYLEQELKKLLDVFSKEEIESALKDM